MKQVSIRLEDETHEQLRKESFDTRKSINQIILEAIEQYFKPNKRKGE